jgi:hypothetical protein
MRRPVIACSVALAVGALAGGLASQTIARRAPSPVPSVLSPRNGQRLPARPVVIKVYLGSARLVSARLNGRPIGADLLIGRPSRNIPCLHQSLADSRGRSCQLLASPSHGLRYGVNVLALRFTRGRSAIFRTVRFRVSGDRPLAAAGRDRYYVPSDTRIRLNGRASLIPPGLVRRLARAGKRASLRYRWQVVQVPTVNTSSVSADDRPGKSDPWWNVPAEMAGADTATPSVELDGGTYRFRLTVTAPNGRTGTDLLTLVTGEGGGPSQFGAPAIDDPPLVGVDTMATDGSGHQGVELHFYRDLVPDCPEKITSDLGTSCFYPDPGEGHKWLQLVVLDRVHLGLEKNISLDCGKAFFHPQEHDFDFGDGGDVYRDNQNPCIRSLVEFVNGLNDNDLVIAVNQPGEGGSYKHDEPPVGVGAALSGKFIQPFDSHNLGIGATGWFDAPGNGADLPDAVRGTFSAIGVPGWTEDGVWKMPENPHTWDARGAGRLETNLALTASPNGATRYAPFAPAATGDQPDSALLKVLTQAPTPWPKATAGQAAALSAIGADKTVGLGTDPRAHFYSSTSDNGGWAAVQNAIRDLSYKDVTSSGFSESDFTWAQTELIREIGALITVNTYLDALAKPYQGASKTLWSDFSKSVSDVVNTDTSNGTGARVFAVAKDVLGGILELIPGVGSLYKWSESAVFAAQVVAGVYGTAVSLTESGESADGGFSAEAANLGKELSDRLDAAETEIAVRFRNIIVADYGKLQQVQLCVNSTSPTCGDHPAAWSVTNNSVANMETVVKMGLQRELFTKLVPAKYPLALGLDPVSQSNASKASSDAAKWCVGVPPFEPTTGVYLWPKVDFDYWRSKRGSVNPDWAFTPIVLTSGDPGGFRTWHAASWTVFGRMFDGVDPGGDFNKGGLGINEGEFMADHYGLKDLPYSPSDNFKPYTETSLSLCPNWEWG